MYTERIELRELRVLIETMEAVEVLAVHRIGKSHDTESCTCGIISMDPNEVRLSLKTCFTDRIADDGFVFKHSIATCRVNIGGSSKFFDPYMTMEQRMELIKDWVEIETVECMDQTVVVREDNEEIERKTIFTAKNILKKAFVRSGEEKFSIQDKPMDNGNTNSELPF